MSDRATSLSATPHNLELDERLRLLEREQGDAVCGVIARRMAAAEHRPAPPVQSAVVPMRVVNSAGATLLSPRHEQVVALVAEGLNNRQIARELNITEHTTKKYLNRIFEKLGIGTRVELVLYAVNNSEARKAERPPADAERLLERAATFLDDLLLDDRVAPSEIIEAKALRDEIMVAIKKPMSVALRAQGRGHANRERKRTQLFLQPLGLPVWIKGEKCLAVVRENFVLSNPRDHEVVDYWFPSVEKARERFPEARLLTLPEYKKPEVPVQVPLQVQVAPRLAAAPPVRKPLALPQPAGRA